MKKDRYPFVTPSGVMRYPLGGNEGATERGRSRRSDGDLGIVKGNLGPEGVISLPDQGATALPLGGKTGATRSWDRWDPVPGPGGGGPETRSQRSCRPPASGPDTGSPRCRATPPGAKKAPRGLDAPDRAP